MSEQLSLESWWIAKLAMELDFDDNRHAVGDWCVEVSSLIAYRGAGLYPDCSIGRILEAAKHGEFLLQLRDGTQKRWENAMMVKIPTPNHSEPNDDN